MEDFSSARAAESTQISALQSEWLEQAKPRFELAATNDGGPGKDVADRLDRELKDFANSDSTTSSNQMKEFHKLVNNFVDSGNKRDAVKEFGPAAAKLRVGLEKDASERFKEMEAEAAKVPGRAELKADFSNKTNQMFDMASKLPSKEYEKFLTLAEWKQGESGEERASRVHEGMKNNPRLLAAFDSADQARKDLQANLTPHEKELAALHKRDIDEAHTIRDVVRKVSIRSQIDA